MSGLAHCGVGAGCGASFKSHLASGVTPITTNQEEAPWSGWEGTHMSGAGLRLTGASGGPCAKLALRGLGGLGLGSTRQAGAQGKGA